jgi:hypothetical protein
VSDQKPDKVPATPALLHRVADYRRAKEARARWEAEEKAIKEEILETLGFDTDDDDAKPTPVDVVDPITGVTMFGVKVGRWRGTNIKALKEERPDILAQYETSKPTVSIKIP